MGQDSVFVVGRDCPARDATGNVHLRQCKPKLRVERYLSLNKRIEYAKTPHDVENRLRYGDLLRRIVRGGGG